jgi:Zn-dependent M28 family amino/carboxypeptidase
LLASRCKFNDDTRGGFIESADSHISNNAIRFIWFAAEEFGLLGAHYYVSQLTPEENLKIRSMTNVDMIGSPNYVLGVYDGDGDAFGLSGPPGSAELEYTFEDYFKSVGRPSVPTAFTGRSDYGPFLEANIPAGGLFTGAEGIKTAEEAALFGGQVGMPYDKNYHQPGDTTKNLHLHALIDNTKAVADLVAKYGRSVEGFPARTLPAASAQKQAAWSHGTHGKNHDHSAGAGGCGDGLY